MPASGATQAEAPGGDTSVGHPSRTATGVIPARGFGNARLAAARRVVAQSLATTRGVRSSDATARVAEQDTVTPIAARAAGLPGAATK